MSYSKVFSVKSNARRAARQQGFEADTVVACSGGFHFPIGNSGVPHAPEPAKKPAKKAKAKAGKKSTKAKANNGESLVDKVHKMITAKGGATMPEILQATGWLPHTARARISGIVAKHKLKIERERLLGVTTYKAS